MTNDHLTIVSENRIRELINHEQAILEYCEKYLDHMWAATIVGFILNCDFREAYLEIRKYKAKRGDA